MPLYEFECGKCQTVFEELVKSGNDMLHCPSCGGEKVEKKMSTFSGRMGQGKAPERSSCADGSCCMGSCGLN